MNWTRSVIHAGIEWLTTLCFSVVVPSSSTDLFEGRISRLQDMDHLANIVLKQFFSWTKVSHCLLRQVLTNMSNHRRNQMRRTTTTLKTTETALQMKPMMTKYKTLTRMTVEKEGLILMKRSTSRTNVFRIRLKDFRSKTNGTRKW